MTADDETTPPHSEIDLRTRGHESELEHGHWSANALRSAIHFQAKTAATGKVPRQFTDTDFEIVPVDDSLLRLMITDQGIPPSRHALIGEDHRFHSWARSVMKDDLDKLASRANLVAAQQGFVHCRVYSYDDRILVFECADHIAAESLCGQRQLLNMKAWIDDKTPSWVFVHQPLP